MNNIKPILEKYKIAPDVYKDQFFLADNNLLEQIVKLAKLNDNDVVLEIGPGVGNLTERLAIHAGKVIAIEIDKRFEPILDQLPSNVEVIYDNAWNHIKMGGKYHHRMFYNKVVSNLPYSFIEPFLHNLTFIEYEKVILMIPIKTLKFINENGIFSSFFKTKILLEVSKDKFYPTPRSNSVVIDLIKLPDPIENKNFPRFLSQQIYKHEKQKVKNSMMHAIINYFKLVDNVSLTKNDARKIISDCGIPNYLLEDTPKPETYHIVEKILLFEL